MPDILYEDNHVLVAVKPPNMLSQADHTQDTDILTLLKEYIREKYHKPGNVYLGLVHRLDRPVGGLMVFARNREVVCEADEKGGKLAILHGRCIDRREGTSLVAIRLETGRKHQIRAQMSNAGLPLWGDNRYGSGMAGQQIALWGYKLTFEHPVSHEIMTFHAMPDGSIWNLYADQLTIPEDIDEKREPDQIHIQEEVVQKLEEFDKFPPVKTDELL